MTRLSSLTKARLFFSTGAALTGALAGSAYVFLVLLPTVLDAGGGRLPENWRASQIWIVAAVALVVGAASGLLCAIFALICSYFARKFHDSQWVETLALVIGVLLSTSVLYFLIFAAFNQLGLTIIVVSATTIGIGASLLLHHLATPLRK